MPLRSRPRLPVPDHGSEEERANWALEQLTSWFHIEREVWGAHCGGSRLRIDAVLKPRDASAWKDENPALGVEFKLPAGSTRDYTAWAAQAVDYTHVFWQGYGRLKIFTCPSPVVPYVDGDAAWLMARLLGQLGVGDLCQVPQRGWAFMLNDHVIWCEADGPVAAKQWSVRSRVGHR